MPRRDITYKQLKLLIVRKWSLSLFEEGTLTKISLKPFKRVLTDMSVSEHKQLKDIQ
jgi:hypothetical protein